MPLYSYRCAHGHLFDVRVRVDQSDAPKVCDFPMHEGTACQAELQRIITAPARSFPGADSWRR